MKKTSPMVEGSSVGGDGTANSEKRRGNVKKRKTRLDLQIEQEDRAAWRRVNEGRAYLLDIALQRTCGTYEGAEWVKTVMEDLTLSGFDPRESVDAALGWHEKAVGYGIKFRDHKESSPADPPTEGDEWHLTLRASTSHTLSSLDIFPSDQCWHWVDGIADDLREKGCGIAFVIGKLWLWVWYLSLTTELWSSMSECRSMERAGKG